MMLKAEGQVSKSQEHLPAKATIEEPLERSPAGHALRLDMWR